MFWKSKVSSRDEIEFEEREGKRKEGLRKIEKSWRKREKGARKRKEERERLRDWEKGLDFRSRLSEREKREEEEEGWLGR